MRKGGLYFGGTAVMLKLGIELNKNAIFAKILENDIKKDKIKISLKLKKNYLKKHKNGSGSFNPELNKRVLE